jgi:hypothetical protein
MQGILIADSKPLGSLHSYNKANHLAKLKVATMKKGERAIFVLAPEKGYGVEGQGLIPPGATLQFDIKLVSFDGALAAAATVAPPNLDPNLDPNLNLSATVAGNMTTTATMKVASTLMGDLFGVAARDRVC